MLKKILNNKNLFLCCFNVLILTMGTLPTAPLIDTTLYNIIVVRIFFPVHEPCIEVQIVWYGEAKLNVLLRYTAYLNLFGAKKKYNEMKSSATTLCQHTIYEMRNL